jgi:hypothetical protein
MIIDSGFRTAGIVWSLLAQDSFRFFVENTKDMVIFINLLYYFGKGYLTAMSNHRAPIKSSKRYYRVDRREISYLRFIFEAYDGMATIETLNPESGLIVIYIAPGCVSDVEMVLRDLENNIMIEPAML